MEPEGFVKAGIPIDLKNCQALLNNQESSLAVSTLCAEGCKMIRYRKADEKDVEALLDLIEKGFSILKNSVNAQQGREHRVLFSYLYSRPGWKPEYVYVAESRERLIAAVGVFPQQLSLAGRYLPFWSVSPVVTHPDYRGKGVAGQCLKMMMKDLPDLGIPAVFLWGIPSYYPRFGFVPILSRYKTKIGMRQIDAAESQLSGGFRPVMVADLPFVKELYHRREQSLWLQPLRKDQWWQERLAECDSQDALLKEVPFPKKENLMLWENSSGEIDGYLSLRPNEVLKRMYIMEAAVKNVAAGKEILRGLARRLDSDLTLVIRGTPDHPLNVAAYELGGMHLNPAPLAGMIKVLNWNCFLETMERILSSRIDLIGQTQDFTIEYRLDNTVIIFEKNHLGLKIEAAGAIDGELNQRLTRLLFGSYDETDLKYIPTERERQLVAALFPKRYPFIWDANYLY